MRQNSPHKGIVSEIVKSLKRNVRKDFTTQQSQFNPKRKKTKVVIINLKVFSQR